MSIEKVLLLAQLRKMSTIINAQFKTKLRPDRVSLVVSRESCDYRGQCDDHW